MPSGDELEAEAATVLRRVSQQQAARCSRPGSYTYGAKPKKRARQAVKDLKLEAREVFEQQENIVQGKC